MIDYKTVLSTTSSKVTLLEYLHALSQEFGESKIDSITLSNSGNKTLTFTFVLADGTIKTASATAITLTEDEKSLISEMIKSVSASSEGVTFNQAVTFAGNVVLKGNEIHQGYESHLGDESHSGTATYKGVIKTSEIDNTAGNAMLRNKDTEGAIVLGSVSKKAVIMGSGDRPTYSKDGSDFAGSELALLSDIGNIPMSTLLSSLGTGRWSNITMFTLSKTGVITDPLLDYYGSYTRMFAFSSFVIEDLYAYHSVANVTIDFHSSKKECNYLFYAFDKDTTYDVTLHVSNLNIATGLYAFARSGFTTIDFTNCTVSGDIYGLFLKCTALENVTGDLDMSGISRTAMIFAGDTALKSLSGLKHWKKSFDISVSTAFEEADLVEILNNLDTVSTTQTLTMGATNLAKLTSDDILIATGKGWALA